MSADRYTVGRLIQQLENYDEKQTLESLLEREEFTSLLHGIYTSLSAESKSTAQEVFRKTNVTKKKRTKSTALVIILGIHNIALPPSIQTQYQIWKENPSQLWRALDGQNSEQSIEVAAIEAYLVAQHLRLRQVYNVILWRFYVSFFYQLALLLGHGQKVMTNNLHNILYERLVKAITQSKKINDDITVIKANLQLWVAAGARYNKICTALDKGALFLIPQIPDDVWENPNSLKGAEFDEAMAHLKSLGIMTLSDQLGADKLANQILNSALDPFRWDVVTTLNVNQPIEPRTSFATEPGTPAANLSIEPRISFASSPTQLMTFAANISVEPRTSTAKPNSISSLLNPA
ncbi:095128ae-e49d-43a5-bec0-a9fe873b9365 [Sclerotinia trifoliorum]|uniref:095128ae-e49d-43a5-bec0-a9fe873b9365 n=1 Tax=Sclerotinia trifoliorum TaxID=28548 RepID=A0A8H2VM08_9HELO|nr:095128ae-e49d-43a5-bec0-a9fe873b9365 [Sclerotinia trifoliorum]